MAKTSQAPMVVRVANILTVTLLRAGVKLKGAGNYPMYLLTVRGRKSGLPRTVPIAIWERNGKRYVGSVYGIVDWVRNLRARGVAILTRGRRSETVTVRELPTGEAALVLREDIKGGNPFARSYGVTADSSLEEFERAVLTHPVFVLESKERRRPPRQKCRTSSFGQGVLLEERALSLSSCRRKEALFHERRECESSSIFLRCPGRIGQLLWEKMRHSPMTSRRMRTLSCILKEGNTMDIWMFIAKALVSLVAIATALGGTLADLVIPTTAKQHMHNPHWLPHAKFHNGQTISLGVFLGLLTLWLLWYPGGDQQVQFQLGVIVAALYWLSMLGASVLPGTRWVDPEFAKETQVILGMPPQLFLLCILLAILIGGEILSFL